MLRWNPTTAAVEPAAVQAASLAREAEAMLSRAGATQRGSGEAKVPFYVEALQGEVFNEVREFV